MSRRSSSAGRPSLRKTRASPCSCHTPSGRLRPVSRRRDGSRRHARLLGDLSSSLGILVEGGLRGQLDMRDAIGVIFEARALFRYERFQASYSGSTSLYLPVQFNNASLTDEV